jgi:hypothetical protein
VGVLECAQLEEVLAEVLEDALREGIDTAHEEVDLQMKTTEHQGEYKRSFDGNKELTKVIDADWQRGTCQRRSVVRLQLPGVHARGKSRQLLMMGGFVRGSALGVADARATDTRARNTERTATSARKDGGTPQNRAHTPIWKTFLLVRVTLSLFYSRARAKSISSSDRYRGLCRIIDMVLIIGRRVQ